MCAYLTLTRTDIDLAQEHDKDKIPSDKSLGQAGGLEHDKDTTSGRHVRQVPLVSHSEGTRKKIDRK
jgi:hypothetical protein